MKTAMKKVSPEQAKKVFDRLNSLVNVMLGAANTIGGRCLFDAYENLKSNKKYYRHNVKRHANDAVRQFNAYEKLHFQNFGERYRLFLDYLDNIEEHIMPHVDKLYWSIKSVLDKNMESGSELRAKVEVARVMIEYSCHVYDRLLNQTYNMSGIDFNPLMRPARLTGVFYSWDKVSEEVCKTSNDINLNADANCKLAFDIIDKVLTSEDTLNKAGYEALKLNPDLIKEIDEKDFEELKERFE